MLGSPISHSLSPVLHRAAYRALRLGDWSYEAIECDEDGLPGLVGSLGPDWAGLSLTMPLKRAVLPLLDRQDDLTTQTGGANTVVFRDGRRDGFNTDVPGMIAALAAAGVREAEGALILGAGATACSALAALRGLGARTATAAVRDPGRAGELTAVADRLDLRVRLAEYGALVPECPLLISTVPAAAADHYARFVRVGELSPAAVLDVIYDPWPTPLAEAASAAGAAVISGFDLLLYQAAGQVELMTGCPAPLAVMREAGLAALPA